MNISLKGGVCRRHGAYRNPNDEFTSEFEKTTATHPTQRDSGSSSNQGCSPPTEVVLCGVIAENYEEV